MYMRMPPLRRRQQRAVSGTPKLRARIQAPGCRGRLSQATSTASRPPRSPDDGANPPKHARRLSKLPPTPVDTLRQPEPPQPDGLLPAAATPKAATTCSPSPAQVVKHGIRTPTRLRRAAATPMGPVLEQELSWVPGALTATWASSLTPLWRNRPAAARTPGANRPAPSLPTLQRRHRPAGHANVAGGSCLGPRAPRRTER